MTKVKEPGDQIIREIEGTNYKVMNWHGFQVVTGGQYGPFFFNEIEDRRRRNRSNIIVITGSPGEGKSYFALELGHMFDPNFDVEVQVVFERHTLMRLISNDSPLERGQVIVVDEAQFALGARNWFLDVQKDLMANLEAVRSKGFIIIIVCLHIAVLDVIIRKFVLSFMVHMEFRGHGIVYRLFTPRLESKMFTNRLGVLELPLPDVSLCGAPDCLICKFKKNCYTIRARYERKKLAFTGKKVKESEAKAIANMQRKESQNIPDEELVKVLHEHRDEFELTNVGTISEESIRYILKKELGLPFSRRRASDVRFAYTKCYGKPEEPT